MHAHTLTLFMHFHSIYSLQSIILCLFTGHTEPLFTVHAFLVFAPVLVFWFCDSGFCPASTAALHITTDPDVLSVAASVETHVWTSVK